MKRPSLWLRRSHAPEDEPAPSEQERQINEGLATLRDAIAREVMTPRVDVVALPAPVKLADVVQAVRRSGRSHFPVYDGDLDRLLGVLFVKDVFTLDASAANGARGEIDVTDRLRAPYIVPESRSALELLSEMRTRRRGFAVVVDEYGGFAGVLTVNDLVSELVGNLHDEFDHSAAPSIVRVDAHRYLVDGSCAVSEVRAELVIDLPDGEYVTIGGYVLDVLGHIPKEGDTIERLGWRFRILAMDRRRIAKVVLEDASATISPHGRGNNRPDGK